jgi:hypothetical protein
MIMYRLAGDSASFSLFFLRTEAHHLSPSSKIDDTISLVNLSRLLNNNEMGDPILHNEVSVSTASIIPKWSVLHQACKAAPSPFAR